MATYEWEVSPLERVAIKGTVEDFSGAMSSWAKACGRLGSPKAPSMAQAGPWSKARAALRRVIGSKPFPAPAPEELPGLSELAEDAWKACVRAAVSHEPAATLTIALQAMKEPLLGDAGAWGQGLSRVASTAASRCSAEAVEAIFEFCLDEDQRLAVLSAAAAASQGDDPSMAKQFRSRALSIEERRALASSLPPSAPGPGLAPPPRRRL